MIFGWQFKGGKGDVRMFGWQVRRERRDMRIFGWQFNGGKRVYEDIWVAVKFGKERI